MTFLDAFAPIYERQCWNVGAVYSSFLALEFGDQHTWKRDAKVAAPPGSGHDDPNKDSAIYSLHGAWHLWLYQCDWRVVSAKTVIGDSSTERGVARAASRLERKILKRVAINADGSALFQFDRYTRLETRPRDKMAEQWFLYKTAGFQVLTCYGDGRLDYDQNENCYEDEDRRIIAARQAGSSSTASTLILKKGR